MLYWIYIQHFIEILYINIVIYSDVSLTDLNISPYSDLQLPVKISVATIDTMKKLTSGGYPF